MLAANLRLLLVVLAALAALLAVCCSQANGAVVVRDVSISSSGQLVRRLRRSPDQADAHKKKSHGKKGSSSTTTTAAPKVTTTTAATSSTSTAAPSDDKIAHVVVEPLENADDDAMKKMVSLQRSEAKLVEKTIEDIRQWVAWLLSHDRRTLNKMRAMQLIDYMESKLKPFVENSYDLLNTRPV